MKHLTLTQSNGPVAYVMCGMPGSGKSTWVEKNLGDVEIVSRDIIRTELGYTTSPDEKANLSKDKEAQVTKAEYARITELAKAGETFVIDDTNTGAFRSMLFMALRELHCYIIGVNVDTPLETCIKRREGQVPENVMRRIHDRMSFIKKDEVNELITVK